MGPSDDAHPSLTELRERILRRIMRIACVLGTTGVLYPITWAVVPWHSVLFGALCLSALFLITFLPLRIPTVSVLYPWIMTTSGVGLTLLHGPVSTAFIPLTGGLFIGSLVASGRRLGLLFAFTVVGLLAAIWLDPIPPLRTPQAMWTNNLLAVAAVALPAAIAGHMIVSALSKSLARGDKLVDSLRREVEIRETLVRELEQAQNQLTHAQKIDLIGQLAGGVAHDMNNALTAVMGEASLLDDRVAEERERILQAAEHAAQLTHQLMTLGRRELTRRRPIDLATTLRRATQSIRRLLSSEITISASFPSGRFAVLADPVQIFQIMLNLASNARDAMTGGGSITIDLSLDPDGGGALLTFADTGLGMSAETLKQIFEPFFTTKEQGAGTGLGLSNVKRIVTELGGQVSAQSTQGQGTTFRIWLPTTLEKLQEEVGDVRHSQTRVGVILVVDDDVRVRAVAVLALERMGYTVLEAPHPEAARALAALEPRLDLLLTDVVMPGGGGAQLIQWLEQTHPTARVLVMSGYHASETLRRGVEQGHVPFIAKPFTADQLMHEVERILGSDAPPGP